jgi:hypothetical protein
MAWSTMPALHFRQVGFGWVIGCISDEVIVAVALAGYPQNYLMPRLKRWDYRQEDVQFRTMFDLDQYDRFRRDRNLNG